MHGGRSVAYIENQKRTYRMRVVAAMAAAAENQ